jgi:putative transposase
MPQSLHCKYGHIVFSTRNREPLITPEIEHRLYEYLGGIVRGANASLIEINGMPDHVHVLIRESKSVADQVFIGQLKGDSSRWINETMSLPGRFSWQDGYGWFSVGPADLDKAAAYVQGQKEHHKTAAFKDEFRLFLKKYNVQFDERYVWD